MNLDLLNPVIQDFINQNISVPVTQLALQKNPFPNQDWPTILNQIAAKTKAKRKLPTWFNTENIVYPGKINIEQTSSEVTANYKASLISGNQLIDLTGGFGIDDYYFSKKFNQVIHCEINDELSEIVSHNFKQLAVQNISCYQNDSAAILKSLDLHFDWIYIDPSRRSDVKGKVFMLKDCLPNVTELLDFYFLYSNHILIKTAPILDISAGLSELKNVKTIHIVAVDNEVKELLWELSKDFTAKIEIKTIDINKNRTAKFEFYLNEKNVNSQLGLPQKYLYEPNNAIMKSGGFNAIGNAFSLKKLHQHSHLYTSDDIITFPGRVFEIQQQFIYAKNDMKIHLEKKQYNITTRNFPETVENIRKKWKIKDGGNQYCFLTTDTNNNKIVLICTKIQS